jgi:sugar phosphate isomerase/epimerase
MRTTISFISANYIGRAMDYRGPADWGPNDQATLRTMTPQVFETIARDVAAAGFESIDIWMSHCHWQHHAGSDYPETVRQICRQHGLQISSYAGGWGPTTRDEVAAVLQFMKRLGAPILAGGVFGVPAAGIMPVVEQVCAAEGLMYALENHPEKSPQEILAKIGNGIHPHCGVALDTGWCGTHAMDALDAVKRLRDKLLIVHLKDVKAAGGHETCALGEGIVPVEQVVRYLVQTRWDGTMCIEHEPYDRDPMPEAITSLRRLRAWLA